MTVKEYDINAVYELELDDEVGPVDDGNSETDPISYIPGDIEVDPDGVEVVLEEPEIGAALPPGPTRKQEGSWSRVFNWPISPIHMALLPDNTILTYGTNPDAQNATAFTFDRWSRWKGKAAKSHATTPTGIRTNLFCSAQTLMTDGNVLLSGGDRNQVLDQTFKNDAIDATTLFDYRTNVLFNGPKMLYPRWYPTLVTLSDGKQLVLGGRNYALQSAANAADEPRIPPMPELYDPETDRWTPLFGATNQSFFNRVWYYPRSWLRHNGNVVIADHVQDKLFELSTKNRGSLKTLVQSNGSFGAPNTPAAMFAPGKILFAGRNRHAEIVDISGDDVRITTTNSSRIQRSWADATVLANGEVFLSGGISEGAADNSGDYPGEIWNPESGQWTLTAKAKKSRLYHSTAILMSNAKVLVAGGGPPGPVINMNAEIFNPPYLFDENGSAAKRPKIINHSDVDYGQQFTATVRNTDTISKVTFVRAGSVTHSFDQGQRFMELDFSQSGNTLTINAPDNANIAPPGLYLLFVLNENGVPSHAKRVMIGEGQNMTSFADPGF